MSFDEARGEAIAEPLDFQAAFKKQINGKE